MDEKCAELEEQLQKEQSRSLGQLSGAKLKLTLFFIKNNIVCDFTFTGLGNTCAAVYNSTT